MCVRATKKFLLLARKQVPKIGWRVKFSFLLYGGCRLSSTPDPILEVTTPGVCVGCTGPFRTVSISNNNSRCTGRQRAKGHPAHALPIFLHSSAVQVHRSPDGDHLEHVTMDCKFADPKYLPQFFDGGCRPTGWGRIDYTFWCKCGTGGGRCSQSNQGRSALSCSKCGQKTLKELEFVSQGWPTFSEIRLDLK